MPQGGDHESRRSLVDGVALREGDVDRGIPGDLDAVDLVLEAPCHVEHELDDPSLPGVQDGPMMRADDVGPVADGLDVDGHVVVRPFESAGDQPGARIQSLVSDPSGSDAGTELILREATARLGDE